MLVFHQCNDFFLLFSCKPGFCRSGMSCNVWTCMQDGNIPCKEFVGSSWCQVGLKLASSWAQVGPRWPHAGSKWRQKSIRENMSKNITFRIALNSIFDRFWPPRWPPREGQNFHFGGLETILEPTWPPGPPRGPPGYPQDPLREPK